jgi:hypothetical protein
MGSHYIQVGKLKFDQELMDIVCPAVGYTPELICPAAGYEKIDDGTFVEPITVPEPGTDEIVLLCSNEGLGRIRFNVKGDHVVEIYNSNNNIIYSQNLASNGLFDYSFPGINLEYFIVRIFPQSGQNITAFKRNMFSGYEVNYPILSASFNTPHLASMQDMFRNVRFLKACKFLSTLDVVTNCSYSFSYTDVGSFVFPESMAEATTLAYMFFGAGIKTLNMNNCLLPKVTSLQSFIHTTQYLRYVNMKMYVPKCTVFTNMMNTVGLAKEIVCDFDVEENSAVVVSTGFLQNSPNVEKFISPYFKLKTSSLSFNNAIVGCIKLKEVTLRGDINVYQSPPTVATTTPSLEYLKMWNSASGINICVVPELSSGSLKFKELILPEILSSSNAIQPGTFNSIEKISGTCLTNTPVTLFRCQSIVLNTLNCPGLPAEAVQLGAVGGKLESVDIEWANSTYISQNNPRIILDGNMSSSEIDRIFGLLPVVSDGQQIRVNYNPGFSSCTPSIAQAKGWTVLGA